MSSSSVEAGPVGTEGEIRLAAAPVFAPFRPRRADPDPDEGAWRRGAGSDPGAANPMR